MLRLFALVALVAVPVLASAAQPNDGSLPTYSATVNALAPASGATDIFAIKSSGGKVLKVKKFVVSGIASSSSTIDLLLIKRSAVNTGGTSTILTGIPLDSSDAAASAVVQSYTANPTVGASTGIVSVRKITLPIIASGVVSIPVVIDFALQGARPLVIRGSEQAVLNWGSQAIVGSSLNIEVLWTEE